MNLPPLSEKKLVVFFFLLFSVSALFLFWQNKRELDPNQGKDWWTLSFEAPGDPNSLVFIVENHTKQSEFSYEATYEVTPDNVISVRDSITVAPGETKMITPNIVPQPGLRTSVIVTTRTEKKEIYR